MAAFFASASSQRLENAAPAILDYPFSVGMWSYLTTTATARTLFALSDTGTTNNYLSLRQTTSNQHSLVASDSATGTENAINLAGLAANVWVFLLARFVSSTARSLHVVRPTGIAQGNSTTSRAPTGLDKMTIGCLQTSGGYSEHLDGLIGEFWIANSDVSLFNGAASLTEGTLFAIAYQGPFSRSHIASNLVEYRSFRKYPSSEGDEGAEVYHGAFGRQTWTNTNGVTTGPHVPLPYWYVKPWQVQTQLVI